MIDVAIDARKTARMSLGMRACVDALTEYLPVVAPDLRFAFVGSGENFSPAEQFDLPRAIAQSGARLAYYPTPYAPALRRVPYVMQVHDLIHVRFPRFYSPAVRLFYATLGRSVIRGAARIIIADEGIGRDLQRYFGVAPERLRVVPLGYDPALLASEDAEHRERPYFLYAGNRRPHKNLATLIAAWRALPEEAAVDLVIAGPGGNGERERFGSRELVALGEVDPDRLRRLYRGALAYVHPALAEGFGLPLLESLASGTPVIASAEATPEVVRPFAQTFPALDVESLRVALAEAVRTPGEQKARAREGALSVRSYTWQRFADSVAAVFRELIVPNEPLA